MPSAPVIDVDELLVPLSGPEPGGKKLPLLDRNRLKEYQRDFDPERDLTNEDRQNPALMAGQERKKAEWDKITDFCTDFLKNTGRDLTVALSLVEALTKQHGFAGARDGFRLLRRMCESDWDVLHPIIEDPTNPDDIDGRMSLFSFLDDEVKTPFYANTIRATVLLPNAKGAAISFQNCQVVDKMTPVVVTPEQFRKSVAGASAEQIQHVKTLDEDIGEALDELQLLCTTLDQKAGKFAPGFSSVQKALSSCRTMANEILRIRNPNASEKPTGADAKATVNSSAAASDDTNDGASLAPVRNREEVYTRLQELTVILEQFDPHSPVPFLVRRAIELRDLKFPELVDQFTMPRGILDFIRQPIQNENRTQESESESQLQE
ncbi:MAG: type VI secretion system ImpA family N-terminal domain-containing protein [Gemmataceae bacterium]